MGVAVGHRPIQATRGAVEYGDLTRSPVKGKAEPVRIFHAVATKARPGADLTRSAGRPPTSAARRSLAELTRLFDATQTASLRYVAIIGEAGMGKSRMVAELRAHVGKRAGPVTWRQGRCLPYGEGITFWALGEVVKAQAGILESDPRRARRRSWTPSSRRGPIRPGCGTAAAPHRCGVGLAAGRDESFAAWRLFLEGMAGDHPAVVVIEDLHWADAAMLAFLEHVAAEAASGPLWSLATTRPSCSAQHPDFAAGCQCPPVGAGATDDR